MPQFPISDAAFYLATPVVLALVVLLFWVVGYDPRRALDYLRRNARWIGLNAVLVIIAAHALMLSPPPPAGSPGVASHRVWGPLQMVVNFDSFEFVADARHPGRLSIPGSYRQTRPLGIMVASLLTLAERPPYVQLLQPGWLSFVILNFVLLLVALMLFRRLNAPASSVAAVAVAILGTYLTFNDVVKGFFWSAHTQMWNVLMPLISIALSLCFLRHPERSWRFMTATGALLGIGSLAYGNLLVCVATAIASIGIGFWIDRTRPQLLKLFGKLCLFLGVFAAPMMIWTSIIKRTTGSFYYAEADCCRMFVWIYDYWKAGGAIALENPAFGPRLQTQLSFLGEFVMHLWHVLWPALILLAIALLVGVMSLPRLKATIKERSRTLTATVITLVMCLCFYLLMGFYRHRLEFNIVVPVIVMATVIFTGLLERMTRKETVVTMLLVVIAAGSCITSALMRITWPY
jgi:hypothetical protein